MGELPPKGHVSLSDLRKIYNLMVKKGMVSQLDDIVFRVWGDMVFSLNAIQEWYDGKGETISDNGSVNRHLNELYAANEINEMIVAIDNCLNNYHGMSMMIEYIINADFDEANKFLNEIRDR